MENNYSLVIYPTAAKDIENICHYLSIELSNPTAAKNLLDELYSSFERVLLFPKMYPVIDNEFISEKSIRKIVVKNYIVFYTIAENEIQVIRVLHGRSDFVTLLV